MTNPTGTWTITINNAFDSITDENDMFKQAFYNLKSLLVSAGWTVSRSNNGSTCTDADNITSKSAVGLGIAGTGAWAVLSSPSGWLPNSGTLYMLLLVETADVASSPYAQYDIRVSNQNYTGGNTTTLPTTAGTAGALTTSSDTLLPWDASLPLPAYMYLAYNTRGDVIFGVKQAGIAMFSSLVMILSCTDAFGGGQGNYRFAIFSYASGLAANDMIVYNILQSSGYTLGIDSGASSADAPLFTSSLWTANTWIGIDGQGETVDFPIDIFSNQATRGRYLGTYPDIRAAPTGLTFGELDDAEDDQTYRKVCVGDLWLYAPTASLPFK